LIKDQVVINFSDKNINGYYVKNKSQVN